MVFVAWVRIIFSLSTREGAMAGRTLVAQSVSSNTSEVAERARRAALRA